MGVEIEGAMQQAPQPGRQSMRDYSLAVLALARAALTPEGWGT
jgi:hypothetical protein